MKTSAFSLALVSLAVLTGCTTVKPKTDWRTQLREQLPVLGHRNFIVIADSAYPAQSNPGIRTIYTGESQLATTREVLAAVEAAPHVHPIVYLDAELASVPESEATGIQSYREAIQKLLAGKNVKRLPHMEIIRKLDESAKLFNVLILKTDLTLPYTSVFIELDCGYWNAESEKRLREKLEAK